MTNNKWDTKPGRQWVVVSNWRNLTNTVTFHRDEQEANEAYEEAVAQGADSFYAETKRMRKQTDR